MRYKTYDSVNKKPEYKSNSMKVEVKTQPGEAKSKYISIYIPVFNTWSPEGLLNLLTLVDKIIKVYSLTTGPQT